MTSHDESTELDTAVRLRRTLAARADRVEPEDDGLAAIERRADLRRRQAGRRRTALTAAAALLVAVGVVGGLVAVAGQDDGDDGRTEVATAGPEDPATVAPGAEGADGADDTDTDSGGFEAVAVWPLPSMSIVYDDPTVAALAFVSRYLGLEGGDVCPRDPVIDGSTATVGVVHHGVCASTGAAESFGPTTYVDLIRNDHTWSVVGSRSNVFEVTTDPAIGPYPRAFDAIVTWASADAAGQAPEAAGRSRVEVLPLGEPSTPVSTGPPIVPGEPYRTTLDTGEVASGDTGLFVLVVTDGVTASTDIVYVGGA